MELIQVAYDIEGGKTFKRETDSLIRASSVLRCDKLTLIAFTSTRDYKVDGKIILIVSAIDWLLGRQ